MTTTWLPIYTGDYLKNTMDFTTEEHGAYFLLIMHYWHKGKIKNNKKTIKNITKISTKKLQNVLSFFEEKDGYLTHETIEFYKQEAIENKEKKANQTAPAREARQKKTRSVTEVVTDPPSPSTSPSSDKDLNLPTLPRDEKLVFGGRILQIYTSKFLEFQKLYPALDITKTLNDAELFFAEQENQDNLDIRLDGFFNNRHEKAVIEQSNKTERDAARQEQAKINKEKAKEKAAQAAKDEDDRKGQKEVEKKELEVVERELSTLADTGDIEAIMKLAALKYKPEQYISFCKELSFQVQFNNLKMIFKDSGQEYAINLWYKDILKATADKNGYFLDYKVGDKNV